MQSFHEIRPGNEIHETNLLQVQNLAIVLFIEMFARLVMSFKQNSRLCKKAVGYKHDTKKSSDSHRTENFAKE